MEYTVEHSGTKGMKWGYTDGKRNGKRIAGEGFDIKETKKKNDVDFWKNVHSWPCK